MLGVCDDGSLTFSLVPLAPVESARSLPAKSTRLILLTWGGSDCILDAWSLRIIYIFDGYESEKRSEYHWKNSTE